MESYLKLYHDEAITNLLNNPDDLLHVSISVNLSHLQRKQPDLYNALLQNTDIETTKWDRCLLDTQKALIEGNMFLEPGYQIKENCHVRFVNMPQTAAEAVKRVAFPNNDNVGQFLQIKGSIIRMSSCRFLEFKREYSCTRCKNSFKLEADYIKSYVFEPPRSCPTATETGCRGTPQPKTAQPQPEHCRDYQEIKLQEIMSERNVPASLVVTLENDLVDTCQPGDCVTVCGTIERRWNPQVQGKRTEVSIALRANSISRDEHKANFGKDLPEHLLFVQAEWQNMIGEIGELAARDLIVQSIAPEIRGMYLVKLAVALSLASCTERLSDAGGASIRGHSHLLLVGDPGLAKSQLLRYAAEISARSVHTTGMGCSAAGLTAAAIKDEGEWQLEAGALVLADGGVCCIDEFNLMRESDKASIHEAMEQQTISMAKAGLVCKLSTRCVVLAATNPKNLYSMSEQEGTCGANIGIGGPLLSRFDVVLILRDIRDDAWDSSVSDHILALAVTDDESGCFTEESPVSYWELEKLQMHFLAVKDVHPKMSNEANMILGAYYKACRADAWRDPSRTTVRLLDSLFRLAQAHARLMFRNEVTPLDAVTVIQLMEASWGFGKIMRPSDLIKADLPIGPSQAQVNDLLGTLNLAHLVPDVAVREIDQNILKRFHRNMLQSKKCESVAKNRWETLLTQPSTLMPSPSGVIPAVVDTVEKPSERLDDLYSKYSFTQHKKSNLRRLKRTAGNEETEQKSGKSVKRGKKSMLVIEEDPALRGPLNNSQVQNIIGSLQKNFENGSSRDQPLEQTNSVDPADSQRSISLASGRSRKDREESFSALLDASNVFEDDSDEMAQKDEEYRAQQHRALFTRSIKMHETVRTDIGDPETTAGTSNSCEIENVELSEPAESRYQYKRPTQRKKTTTVTQNSLPSTVPWNHDDLMDIEFESVGSIFSSAASDNPATNATTKPHLSTQTRQKLLQFEFPKQPPATDVVRPEDDSAYDSMTMANGSNQLSQYAGLVNRASDDDFNLSDIEL